MSDTDADALVISANFDSDFSTAWRKLKKNPKFAVGNLGFAKTKDIKRRKIVAINIEKKGELNKGVK